MPFPICARQTATLFTQIHPYLGEFPYFCNQISVTTHNQMSFISNLFSNKKDKEQAEKDKNFDMFKFDGVRAQRMGKNKYAEQCFLKALEIKEEYETLFYLANLYIANGMDNDAINAIERMMKCEPDIITPYEMAAQVMLRNNMPEKAEDYILKALQTDSNNAELLCFLASAEAESGKYEEAIRDASKAIAIKEDFIDALIFRAGTYLKQGDSRNALTDAERVMQLDENNESAIKLTAEIYSAECRKEEAVEMFDKMILLNPYNSEAYSGKARILTEEGKAEAAKDVLDEAIDINPAEADLYKARAEAKSKLGDEKGSEEDMAKCKELSDAEKEKANDLTDKEKKTEFDNIIGIFK